MPIPETPLKCLGDNGNWFLEIFYFPSAFLFVCLFALAQISTPGHCHAKPDTE